jgi:hypothetical protein
MHILLIVLGLLLMLFGGGCTLVFAVLGVGSPANFLGDMSLLLSLWLPLGLAPLVGGFFLVRVGLKADRDRKARPPPPEEKV